MDPRNVLDPDNMPPRGRDHCIYCGPNFMPVALFLVAISFAAFIWSVAR